MKPSTIAALALLVLTGCIAAPAAAEEGKPADYPRVVDLLQTDSTVLGQPLPQPGGPMQVTSMIVTMEPGEETGRHRHPVPTYGYILEGEVTIAYEGHGEKVYKAGDAFMEAVHVWHNGRATGAGPTRILAVFVGADGIPNVIRP